MASERNNDDAKQGKKVSYETQSNRMKWTAHKRTQNGQRPWYLQITSNIWHDWSTVRGRSPLRQERQGEWRSGHKEQKKTL